MPTPTAADAYASLTNERLALLDADAFVHAYGGLGLAPSAVRIDPVDGVAYSEVYPVEVHATPNEDGTLTVEHIAQDGSATVVGTFTVEDAVEHTTALYLESREG